jgi:hypothetical protein
VVWRETQWRTFQARRSLQNFATRTGLMDLLM